MMFNAYRSPLQVPAVRVAEYVIVPPVTTAFTAPLCRPSAVSDNPLTVLLVAAPASSVYPMVTVREQPLPEVAAVVVVPTVTTRYIPSTGDETR